MVVATGVPSVPELIQAVLSANADLIEAAPGGVMVGPASHEQQQLGCVALNQEGQGERVAAGIPLVRHRMACRCLAPTGEVSETITRCITACLHDKSRRVVMQPSTGEKFLVHYTAVTGGPTDTEAETAGIVENTLVIDALVGTEVVA